MRSRRLPTLLLLLALLTSGLPLRPSAAAQALPRVRIEGAGDATVLVHGTYPRVRSRCVRPVQPLLHARYRGPIEVGLDTDGSLFLIGELPLEDYLKGIAEVPRRWPMEALKAQVVAARSYALARMGFPDTTGSRLGYDLCATDACQVYRGMGIERGPWGERWVRAVEATRGEVLLDEGRPAETLYFSTSRGETLGNERVFGGEPRPYLRPVEEPDDGDSPVSRWTVAMPFEDLTRFLADAGLWSGPGIREVRRRGDGVVLVADNRRVRLSRAELRAALNASAPCLDPDTYPTGSLPQTVPSVWYSVRSEGRVLTLRGRGWGHGVGMVQWGAYGKASRGLGFEEILAAYYGGLRPERYADAPESIRVGIATGLRSVTVLPSGEVRLRGPLDLEDGRGPWRFTGGRELSAEPAGAPRPQLSVTGFRAPDRARAGRAVRAALRADRAVNARLALVGEEGRIPLGSSRPFLEGRIELRGAVPDDLVDGTYRIVAEVTDGIDEVETRPARIEVTGGLAAPSPGPSPDPSPTPTGERPAPDPSPAADGGRTPWWPAAAIGLTVGLLAALGALELARRRAGARRGRRGPPRG